MMMDALYAIKRDGRHGFDRSMKPHKPVKRLDLCLPEFY